MMFQRHVLHTVRTPRKWKEKKDGGGEGGREREEERNALFADTQEKRSDRWTYLRLLFYVRGKNEKLKL